MKRIFSLLLAFAIIIPSTSFAVDKNKAIYPKEIIVTEDMTETEYNDKLYEILEPYLKSTDEGIVIFNLEGAKNNGLSDFMKELGMNVEKASRAYINNNISTYGEWWGLGVYGKYCGPGHHGGTPIDVLDEGCRQHDSCYPRPDKGYFNCSCNRDFVRYIDNNLSRMDNITQRNMARAIRLLMQNMGCEE